MTDLLIRVGGDSAAVERNYFKHGPKATAREYVELFKIGGEDGSAVRVRPGQFVFVLNDDEVGDMTHAQAMHRLDCLAVYYVLEFVHQGVECARLANGSDDVYALVCACRVYADIKQRVSAPRTSINDHDLVLCDQPVYVSADSFVAVMPAVLGAGPETLGFDGPRRVSAQASGAECEWIVPYDIAPDQEFDKVRLVQLNDNSPLLEPYDDVVRFWHRPAKVEAKKATPQSVKAKRQKAPAPVKEADDSSSTHLDVDEVNDHAAKKKRSEAVPAWEQYRVQLTSYIISLLTTESPEEIEFRQSAEAREASRLACLKCDAKLANFVDSVVLDERNTQAAAAFVSRFEEPLAYVAASLLLRPLVAMRAAALSLAAGVHVPTLPSRILTLAAQLRASTVEFMKEGCGFSFLFQRARLCAMRIAWPAAMPTELVSMLTHAL